MKSLKKKLAALGVGLAVMATSASSLSASAIFPDYDNWRPFYAPYTGSFYADTSVVQVSGMKWSASQIKEMAEKFPCGTFTWYGLEFEFRPHIDPDGYTRPVNKNLIWGVTSTTYSNFPSSYVYYENQPDDPDDVSIGVRKVDVLVAGNSYYAAMNFRTGAMSPYIDDYTFEVEIGKWITPFSNILNDYDPVRYTRYLDHVNQEWFANTYSW